MLRLLDAVWITSAVALTVPVYAFGQSASVAGKIVDFRTDDPLASAEVMLLDETGRVVARVASDSLGAFHYQGLGAGVYRIRAVAPGYKEVLSPQLSITDNEVSSIVLRVDADVIPLAPLEVIARSRPTVRHSGLAAFHERVQRRIGGRTILPDEIMLRSPRHNTDLLSEVGVDVLGGGLFVRRTSCPPTVYLDGIRLTRASKGTREAATEAYDAVNSVPPTSLEGIEVYTPANVPAEFRDSRAACGVILLWMKRGA